MNKSKNTGLYLTLALLVIALGVIIFYLASNRITDEHPPVPDISTSSTPDKPSLLGECPKLEDFDPIAPYTGAIAEVNFSSFEGAEQFSAVLSEDVKKGPNLAGNYRVVEWGCGTACQNEAVVNLETGGIVALGLLSTLGVSNSVESPYLVLNPRTNVQNAGEMFQHVETQIYKVEDDRLKYICNVSTNQAEEVCAQVHVEAKNMATGEVLNFANPCKVPDTNWEILPPASNQNPE